MRTYGLHCRCHGDRLFATSAERDAAAITYQCRARFFRLRTPENLQESCDRH